MGTHVHDFVTHGTETSDEELPQLVAGVVTGKKNTRHVAWVAPCPNPVKATRCQADGPVVLFFAMLFP